MVQSLQSWPALLAVVLALFSPGVAQQGPAGVVRVAAASDLRFALEDLATMFRSRHPATRLELSFGSSGAFHTQILQGAPFDVFLSADLAYTRDIVAKGRADTRSTFVYAIGHLVLWTPSASRLDLARGMHVLTDPRVRHISIANPRHAPYGRAAQAAMKAAGVWQAAQPKLVLGESVTQAAQFVESGAAEIGVIARSLALAPQMRAKGKYWDVPPATYAVMEQGGVVLSSAADPAAAMQFRDFLLSVEAAAVLTRYGFGRPDAAKSHGTAAPGR
jgi:molybdate transport system substrate-binding protein